MASQGKGLNGSRYSPSMHPDLSPTYYLDNFQTVLTSVSNSYSDLLSPEEAGFLDAFARLSPDAQALLVRLLMRTRDIYPTGILAYPEISDIPTALKELDAASLVRLDAPIGLDELFVISTKPILVAAFSQEGARAALRKTELRESMSHLEQDERPLGTWLHQPDQIAVRLLVRTLVDRFRLLFFGNLYQDWSEFVVTDLGHLRYEAVEFALDSRGFNSRQDIDASLRVHELRGLLDEEADLEQLRVEIGQLPCDVAQHIHSRMERLKFHLGQAAERRKDWGLAHSIYQDCNYKGARHRLMRVQEQRAEWSEAYLTAEAILAAPAGEEELQATLRAMPRLARKLGRAAPLGGKLQAPVTHELVLSSSPEICVEYSVAEALSSPDCTVHYVENALFNSLFGLTFWDAIFKPVPGAFFNAFQAGPVDLFHPDFAAKRETEIAQAFASMKHSDYAESLITTWHQKLGLQNPFVFWETLTESLLAEALAIIPRDHLTVIFQRMLLDLRANRSGFPDLIAFMPGAVGYELIEVKGPGDRIQDNQARWVDHFGRHGIPCRLVNAAWAN